MIAVDKIQNDARILLDKLRSASVVKDVAVLSLGDYDAALALVRYIQENAVLIEKAE